MSKNDEPTSFYIKISFTKIPENSGTTKYKVVLEFYLLRLVKYINGNSRM